MKKKLGRTEQKKNMRHKKYDWKKKEPQKKSFLKGISWEKKKSNCTQITHAKRQYKKTHMHRSNKIKIDLFFY